MMKINQLITQLPAQPWQLMKINKLITQPLAQPWQLKLHQQEHEAALRRLKPCSVSLRRQAQLLATDVLFVAANSFAKPNAPHYDIYFLMFINRRLVESQTY